MVGWSLPQANSCKVGLARPTVSPNHWRPFGARALSALVEESLPLLDAANERYVGHAIGNPGADAVGCHGHQRNIPGEGGGVLRWDEPPDKVKGHKRGWGYIDKFGEFVISPWFYHAGIFTNGLAIVKRSRNGAPVFINKSGKIVLDCEQEM